MTATWSRLTETALLVRHSIHDSSLVYPILDCTGSTQGLAWLDKAGYGKPDSRDTKALPLNELRVTYDPKIRYSTLEFPVSDDLLKRINLPDGMSIHTGLTHPWKNNESVYALKTEGNFSRQFQHLHVLYSSKPIVQLCAGSWGGKLPTDLDGFIKFAEERYKEKPDPEYFIRFLNLLREVEDKMTFSKVSVREFSFFCLYFFRQT